MCALVIHLGRVLVFSAAGACVFLVLANRFLILLPDSKVKGPLMGLVLLALVGGGGASGLMLPWWPWGVVPVLALAGIAAGEARRVWVRHECAGSKPIDSIPHSFRLGSPITTTDLVVHRYRIELERWEGRPFRIAHLSDLHVHTNLPVEYYQEVVATAEAEQPDIALFTGDFITDPASLPVLRQVLRPIAAHGTFASLGNHDYWADATGVMDVVRGRGLTLLHNETRTLAIDEYRLAVSGYDYPWGTGDKTPPATPGELVHLVLSHTPDNIYRLARVGADAVFSGHYHAGQLRLPILGSIVVPSIYGRRFDHGHFAVDGTHLFVASGVGAANPPVRVYCQPDIFVVDVSAAAAEAEE